MEIKGSRRVQQLGSYAFDAIDTKVQLLRDQGLAPVDFGVGDPIDPPPPCVLQATAAGIEKFKSSGYPPYGGRREYLQKVAEWNQQRFGVELDPLREVCATVGSKEAVFHFPEAVIDPGDIVLVPDPGYPPYARGTLFAEGVPYPLPLSAEHNYFPDLDAIPKDVAQRARIFWLTHPNSPAGTIASREYLKRWIEFCQENDIIAASDEAYTEIYFGPEKPHSALEISREGVIVFQSLSKRSAMTSYRVGWVCGDERLVSLFRKVKTNVDSGTPWFVQEGAIAALNDEAHVEEMRQRYRAKRDVLVNAFAEVGCPRSEPQATLYIWQQAPRGMTGLQLAERLLHPDVAAVTMPGAFLSTLPAEQSSATDYIRLALVPDLKDCERVAERIMKVGLRDYHA